MREKGGRPPAYAAVTAAAPLGAATIVVYYRTT